MVYFTPSEIQKLSDSRINFELTIALCESEQFPDWYGVSRKILKENKGYQVWVHGPYCHSPHGHRTWLFNAIPDPQLPDLCNDHGLVCPIADVLGVGTNRYEYQGIEDWSIWLYGHAGAGEGLSVAGRMARVGTRWCRLLSEACLWLLLEHKRNEAT